MRRPSGSRSLLVSAAALGYEILLMRLLSIVQWHHFACDDHQPRAAGLRRERHVHRFAARAARAALSTSAFAAFALLFGVTALGSLRRSAQHVPFNRARASCGTPRQLAVPGALYMLLFVPFFFAACCIGLALTCRSDAISRLYCFDLVGAGSGAVLVVGAPVRAFPQAALRVPGAAWRSRPRSSCRRDCAARRRRAAVPALQFVACCWWLASPSATARRCIVSEYKGLSQALEVVDSRMLHESLEPARRCSPSSRARRVPFRHAPGLSFGTQHVPPEQLAVFTDAEGMSAITRYDGDRGFRRIPR